MLTLMHTVIAIIGTILLITLLRVNPAIALLVGAIYLGLAAGLGFEGTVEAIVRGFGDLMAEIGLIIAFGVLIGALLLAMGALQKLVSVLTRAFGAERLPYALGVPLSTIFAAIYADVLLVVAAPLVRSAAPQMRRGGIAALGAAVSMSLLVGLVFVVPGAGALAAAGLLEVPLGTMLLYGLLTAVPTVIITIFCYNMCLKRGLWNRAKDEEAVPDENPVQLEQEKRGPPLVVSLAPLLVALLLVALGAVVEAIGLEIAAVGFFSDPTLALFLGLVGTYVLARSRLSADRTDGALRTGFGEMGSILVITGVGGSLAAIIGETGLGDFLGGFFSAGAISPILLAWLVAAMLDVAIGSSTLALITSAGILAPIVGDIEVSTVLIALACGSGALFAAHVNANFFWMCQTLLGLSTRGTFKTYTLARSIASVVSLLLISGFSLVL